jgi:hypothetical protein
VKIYADLYKWNGELFTIEIEERFIQDIVDAVEGQYTFIDNDNGLCVRGEQFRHVDIYTKGEEK